MYQLTELTVVAILKSNEIRLRNISFFNLLNYFPHRHACITILLGLNQLTAFVMLQSKLITLVNRIQKPNNN